MEGKDDLHVVWAICKASGLQETFAVEAKAGLSNLQKTAGILNAALSAPDEYPGLARGIILDADQHPQARWQSIRNMLTSKGYLVPDRPDPHGTVLRAEGLVTFGIWMMPDNQSPGELEDFMRLLIPEQDRLLHHAVESLNRMEAEHIQRYPAQDRSKALLHTWLAWQEQPGKPMGQSVTAQHFDLQQPVCAAFVHWLKTLFAA
ncbi:MAG: DUF3226 domain-containing protein [Bacteroidia bacterium]|nr:DUF3226 domain-containing protein [Bacteroidia bacterium]